MNDEIIEELVRQIASLEKRLDYMETVEKNVFSTVTVEGIAEAKILNLTDETALTLSANTNGVITVTQSWHLVDTYDTQATGDLETINGGSIGDILVIRPNHSDRTIVAKDGADNLLLAGEFTMDNSQDNLTLLRLTDYWIELSRSNNA